MSAVGIDPQTVAACCPWAVAYVGLAGETVYLAEDLEPLGGGEVDQ